MDFKPWTAAEVKKKIMKICIEIMLVMQIFRSIPYDSDVEFKNGQIHANTKIYTVDKIRIS